MSTEITDAFVKQYSANVFHLSQQKGSRLQGAVRNESQKAKSAFYDRIGSTSASKKTSRHSDTPRIDVPHSRRRVTMSDYEISDLVDDQDKIRMLIDPASQYAQAFMWGLGRSKDDVIIEEAFGTAYAGEDGSTSVAWPDAQKLAAINAAASGQSKLNVEALRRAKKMLDQAEVDPSIKRYCVPNALQVESLLSETEVTSADYNSVRALVSGELNTFLGFEFIRSERILSQSGAEQIEHATGLVGDAQSANNEDADGSDRVLCFAQDGLLLSTGMEVKGRISERDDKSYSTQVYASMSLGATRMEEEKVVEILCVES